MFEQYVSIFPWDDLPPDAVGFDAGCGSGRWAKFFAERVGQLHCIDASGPAIEVARRTLAGRPNVRFYHEDLENISLADESCDFGYSLGVLHHIPDPLSAAQSCVNKLKPGAPFLVYLYYSLENAGVLRRALLQAVTISSLCRLTSTDACPPRRGRRGCRRRLRAARLAGTGRRTPRSRSFEGAAVPVPAQVLLCDAQRRPRSIWNKVGAALHTSPGRGPARGCWPRAHRHLRVPAMVGSSRTQGETRSAHRTR